MKSLNTLLAMTLLMLCGCAAVPPATQATLTYESVPDGAEIFEGGKSLGYVPVTQIGRAHV